jgi:hypothetical protein
MANAVIFENEEFYKPGGYAKFKLVKQGSVAVDVATMIIIGESLGGIPYSASDKTEKEILDGMTFNNVNDVENKVREGDLLDGADLAFTPTNDPNLIGTRRVILIRVNQATRSTIDLKGNLIDNMRVWSRDYGKHTNRTAIQVDQVTDPVTGVTGAVITVYKDSAIQVSPELYKPLMEIQYVGAELNANLTFVSAQGALKVNNGTIDFIDILASDYPTIGELANYLEANDFTVTILDSAYETAKLDDINVPMDIKTTAKYVSATFEYQLRWLDLISEFTEASQITATLKKPLDTLSKVFLTGGTETVPVLQDWIDAIVLAEKVEAFYQIELSGILSISQLNKNSVISSNNIKSRRERNGGSGNGDYVGTTKSQRQQEAKDLGNSFYIYGASPFDRVNRKGVLTTYEPKFLPCLSLGINSGNGPTTASTFKALNVIGNPEGKYSDSEIDAFIKAGCQIIQNNELTGNPQIVRSVTTYQGSNLIASEQSMIATALAVTKDFRIQLENTFVGQTPGGGTSGSKDIIGLATAKAIELLDGYVISGYFSGNEIQSAYSNLEVVIKGDSIFIKVDGTITPVINFIFGLFNLSTLGL